MNKLRKKEIPEMEISKNKKNYTIRLLKKEDSKQAFELHKKIFDSLQEEAKKEPKRKGYLKKQTLKFFLDKTEEQIKNLINGKNGKTIGIFEKEKLIGKATLFKQENLSESKIIPGEIEGGYEIGSLAINKNYRGNYLASNLVEYILQNLEKLKKEIKEDVKSLEKSKTRIFTEVCMDNTASMKAFFQNGFVLNKVFIGKSSSELCLLTKPLDEKIKFTLENKEEQEIKHKFSYKLTKKKNPIDSKKHLTETFVFLKKQLENGLVAHKINFDKKTKKSTFELK